MAILLVGLCLSLLQGIAATPMHLPLPEAQGTALPGVWTTVTTGNSMPSSFRSRRPNTILHTDALRPVFDTLCYSGRPLRILQLGDSHVAGKTFPQTFRTEIGKALGLAASDSAGTGITFSYMAKNGATAKRFLTSERLQQIRQQQPDLVILSFGTNECHGWGYRENDHRRELDNVMTLLREYCPNASFLMTTPPGDYLSQRQVTYHRNSKTGKKVRRVKRGKVINPMSNRCAMCLVQYAADHQMAVWDLNGIAGGDLAARNWSVQHFMRPDRIHFTPQGYQLQGQLLAEAFTAAYNDYIQHREY